MHLDSNRISKRKSSDHERNQSDMSSLGERARKLQEQLHSLTVIEDYPTSQSIIEQFGDDSYKTYLGKENVHPFEERQIEVEEKESQQ
jgi:predicted nuclease with RNAse H fold